MWQRAAKHPAGLYGAATPHSEGMDLAARLEPQFKGLPKSDRSAEKAARGGCAQLLFARVPWPFGAGHLAF